MSFGFFPSPVPKEAALIDGSLAVPAIRFADDIDTGIFSPADGKVDIVNDGVANFRYQKNGVNLEFGDAALIDNLIGGQHAANFMYNGNKTYVRSLMIAEEADTPDLAIRRVNGTLEAPTPMLIDELIGVLYWQPWLGDPRGWGTGVSPAEGRSAMLFSRLTDPANAAPDYFSGGTFSIGVTRHGTHTIQERFWVNHDGSLVVAGQAREPFGLIDSTTIGLAAQKALIDVYCPDDATKPVLALRHDDDISEGYNITMVQATNELVFKRSIENLETEIFRLNQSGAKALSLGVNTSAPAVAGTATINGALQCGNDTDGVIIESTAVALATPNAAYIRRRSDTGDLEIHASSTVARELKFFPSGLSGFVSLTLKSNLDAEFAANIKLVGDLSVGANKVVGAQQTAVADAAAGAVIDVEARAAINALLARMRNHGLIAT